MIAIDKYELEKLKLEFETVQKLFSSIQYSLPIFERDLKKAFDQLDRNSNQK